MVETKGQGLRREDDRRATMQEGTMRMLVDQMARQGEMIEKLNKRMDEMAVILQRMETDSAARHPVCDLRIERMSKQVEEQEKRVELLDRLVIEMVQTNKILKWTLGVVTALFIAGAIGMMETVFRVVATH